MNDTPEQSKPLPEDNQETPEASTPPTPPVAPTKPEKTAAAPVRPPSKPVAVPAPKPAAAKAPTPAPKPISTAPKAAASKKPSLDSSIFIDDDSDESKVSAVSVVIDGLAAAIAVAFTILILQDALPFL